MKVIETEIEWLKVAGMGVYSLSRGVVVAEVVRPWGGQHGRRKLLWQFTVAIKSDPVAPMECVVWLVE